MSGGNKSGLMIGGAVLVAALSMFPEAGVMASGGDAVALPVIGGVPWGKLLISAGLALAAYLSQAGKPGLSELVRMIVGIFQGGGNKPAPAVVPGDGGDVKAAFAVLLTNRFESGDAAGMDLLNQLHARICPDPAPVPPAPTPEPAPNAK